MMDGFDVEFLCWWLPLVALWFVLLGLMSSWWVPLAIIGVIVVGVVIYVVYVCYQSYREELAVARTALIKRADEEHWWLMNGVIENDVEAMDLGFYGQYPPERIVV